MAAMNGDQWAARRVSRRRLLTAGARGAGLAAFIAACGPARAGDVRAWGSRIAPRVVRSQEAARRTT